MPELLHVTDIFPAPDFPIPESALYRGKWVHAYLDLIDKGRTPDSEPPEKWRGFIEAWQLAKQQLGIIVVASEEKIIDKRRGYQGTRDKRVMMRIRRGEGITDLKLCAACTGAYPWWIGLQTAGYVGEAKLWRSACILHPDGTFRWYDDKLNPEIFQPGDWREFTSHLFVFQRDIARGLREMPAPREE